MTTIALVEKNKEIRDQIVEKLQIFSHDIEKIVFFDSMEEANKIKALGDIVFLINKELEEYLDYSSPYGAVYDASNLDAIDEYVLYIHEKKKNISEVFDSILKYQNILDRLVLNDTKDNILLPWSEIVSIERVKRYSLIKTKSEKIYATRQSFEELMPQLGSYFVQTHRSYIVNLACVENFHRKDFEMVTGDIISVSRTFIKPVLKCWTRYKEIHNLE
ncbi:MAG: LytTR family transcriptional regulator DNA-binding domain-containing protein [Bacillota bacterium]|nr:LytTR family transcriptional regulator DNA-binding domain-containing protein [Bacillota bacterium]